MLVQGSTKPAAAAAAPQTDAGIDPMDVDPPKESTDGAADEAGPSNVNAEQTATATDGANGAAPVPDSSTAAAKVPLCKIAHVCDGRRMGDPNGVGRSCCFLR